MASVGRYVKLTAREGQGDALARLLLDVADGLSSVAGCELYVINRSPFEPDAVWVTELWLTQEALDGSLETEAAKAHTSEVKALLARAPERVDVEPVGGVGYLPGGEGSTLVSLEELEDQAPRFGFGDIGEARFANRALGTVSTGISHQRLRPGARQAFGHHHVHAEEVYVVLAGSGRIKIDGETRDVRALDAIRVAPESTRAFEAGPDGLDVLAVGPRHPGDARIEPDFWRS